MESKMIPIPPSHWVRPRQKRTPLEVFSISAITVEPVVVKPEAASKQASARESKVPVNR